LKDDAVMVVRLNELSESLASGSWHQDMPVFNNLVSTKGEMSAGWIVPAKQTWLKRYLTKIVL
jgi:hypothetical protein